MTSKKITRAGIIITLSVALLLWGLNFLQGKNIFKKDIVYYTVYKKIEGLTVSAPVLISGLGVGQVRHISFMPDNSSRVLVKFALETKLQVPKNSVAEIFSSDLMGTKAIRIILGNSMEYLKSGDTLESNIEGDLKDQVSMEMLPLKNKAEKMMGSIDSVLSVIRFIFNAQNQNNLSKSFASIKTALDNLEYTTFLLDTMMMNERSKISTIFTNLKSITSNLNNMVKMLNSKSDDLERTITNVASITDSLRAANLAHTVRKADEAITAFSKIITKINKGQGTLGLLLYDEDLYNNLNASAANMNALLKDVQKNPKKYVQFSAFGSNKTNSKVDTIPTRNSKNEIKKDYEK